jgi:hypothetical protein
MAKSALFVCWGTLIPGREKVGRTVLDNAMQFCGRLQKEGKLDSFETVALESHGGDLEGFVLVKGDAEALAHLRNDNDFLRMMTDLRLVHQSVGVMGAYTGNELQSLIAIRDEQLAKLT